MIELKDELRKCDYYKCSKKFKNCIENKCFIQFRKIAINIMNLYEKQRKDIDICECVLNELDNNKDFVECVKKKC
jgi:hypothetical protein